MKIEFTMTIERSRPIDHEVDLLVCAEVRRVRGEPGSLAITDGWEIDRIAVDSRDGLSFDTLSATEQERIEDEVRRRAG